MPDRRSVLVTGGAGFIGSHVADAFIEQGCDVAVLDNLSSGRAANVPAAASLFEADLTDAAAVDRVFGDVRPQIVLHQAAHISVSESTRDPVGDALANIIGTLVLLEASRRAHVEHIVFASTGGALYGDPERIPVSETAQVLPLSPYGAAKASVETYLRTYRATWGLSYTALRYANAYGPRQTAGGEAGVVAIFAAKMLAGETPVVFGDGEAATGLRLRQRRRRVQRACRRPSPPGQLQRRDRRGDEREPDCRRARQDYGLPGRRDARPRAPRRRAARSAGRDASVRSDGVDAARVPGARARTRSRAFPVEGRRS